MINNFGFLQYFFRQSQIFNNRVGEKGSWDITELEAEFKELIIAEGPIELSGFGPDEIDQILIGSEDENVGPRLLCGCGAQEARLDPDIGEGRGRARLSSTLRARGSENWKHARGDADSLSIL